MNLIIIIIIITIIMLVIVHCLKVYLIYATYGEFALLSSSSGDVLLLYWQIYIFSFFITLRSVAAVGKDHLKTSDVVQGVYQL
jgi:hypothetical protein